MCADTRIQTNTVNDLSCIQSLGFRIGIQLVEVADPQRQIGVCKQLYSLRLGKAHEQRVDVLLDRPLLQQRRKRVRRLAGILIAGHDDPAGIEIIVQRLALPQEFRAENDIFRIVLLPDGRGIPHRNGGLDDHHGAGVHLQHQLDDRLHR